ncbi:MAG: hypothetical protein CVT49_15225 [candidate division Zixibacteria bacterium HGW-Zixibacteria-1]|nr:MAG: hypothetical protein CVT49_15225 [candidate division Zixibacteria bacterium HGW-Zixibacteria-1]
MKYSVLFLIIFTIFVACGDEYYGSSPDDNPTYVTIETEPALSSDGTYIYYISTDTSDSYYSGIFRVSVASLQRQKLVHGLGYHSPTVSFNNNNLAYLDAGRINYQSLFDMSHRESSIPDSFLSIAYIRDSILVASRNDSIFVVTDSGDMSPLVPKGWDPTILSEDTFLYFTGKSPDFYVVRNNIYGVRPETLFSMSGTARPRWPAMMTGYNYLSYEIADWSRHYFYVRKTPSDTAVAIGDSKYAKSILLKDGRILFTGDIGQFVYSNYIVTHP